MREMNHINRQLQKKRLKIQRQRELYREIRRNARDILYSENFQRTKNHIQHGDVTVNDHCLSVATQSLAIGKKLKKMGVRYNERELIRGALLHDYFLYDWHDKDHVQLHRLHGFYHPGVALTNAQQEYKLTPRERDIIKKHMWPLTVVPPMCREAWIVTTADKYCSLLETLRIRRGKRNRKIRPGY